MAEPVKFEGYLSGRAYFATRVGWRWEVWFEHQDGTADPNGSRRWIASNVKYWRWINAARAANDLWSAFNAGVWCAGGRAAAFNGAKPGDPSHD